jgi:hypothetical protein
VVKAPAATSWAEAIVVFGSDSDARLSHDAAAAAGARSEYHVAAATAATTNPRFLTDLTIRLPFLFLSPAPPALP